MIFASTTSHTLNGIITCSCFPDGRTAVKQAVYSSVGIVEGEPRCDLEYVEDSAAETDMNVVMTEDGRMVEVQGTAEGEPFSHDELMTLLGLAKNGIEMIMDKQRAVLAQA